MLRYRQRVWKGTMKTEQRKKWEKEARKLGRWALNLLYPKRCPGCEDVLETGELICRECRMKLLYIREPACKKCGSTLESEQMEYCYDCSRKQHVYEAGKAVFVHQGIIRDSLYRFKYADKRDYAGFYAAETARKYGNWIKSREIDAIVPIPLHKKRRRKRGYNQADLYANELGELLELPVLKNALVRVKNTRPQKDLSALERKNNLKKAFKCNKSIVQSKKLLVVDDIYTTGSTIDAAAGELQKAGAQKIYFASVSIGRGL